jgi:hypothetical protein
MVQFAVTLQDKRRKAMEVSEQKAATKNFLRSLTQQQQERQMEEALVKYYQENLLGASLFIRFTILAAMPRPGWVWQ